jgi:uncharacterized protein
MYSPANSYRRTVKQPAGRTVYEERFYRSIAKPADLLCYEVKIEETDLLCCTKTNMDTFIGERVLFYRNQLEEYIKARPMFRDSLTPVGEDLFSPRIVRAMIQASSQVGVGPMATVAGAIAEFVGQDVSPYTREYIVENGGDISLHTHADRVVLVYAKSSPFSGKIGIRLRGRDAPYGVCTSSATVGPSLSLGNADAVCIVADSALFADGLATCLGNIVQRKDDIAAAIQRGTGYPGVIGILIIMGDHLGLWGDLEVLEV